MRRIVEGVPATSIVSGDSLGTEVPGATFAQSPVLKAINLLFGLSVCIQVSVMIVLASLSRAHTGRTGLSGGGAAWLQKLSRWDVSTPDRRMSHGSATDWRMLSS